MQTLYDVLKVQEDAPLEVIRAAYKVLSSRYHPDKNPNDFEASEMMQRINRAYSILRDPEARAHYDAALKRSRDQQQRSTQIPEVNEPQAQKPSNDASPRPRTHATHQSFMGTASRIWNGQESLSKTYWVYGVLASGIWGLALRLVTPGSATAITLLLAFVIYLVTIHVGIWRAANRYAGHAAWAILAKCAVAGPIAALLIGTAAAIILPTYQDYKTKAVATSQPLPSESSAFDPSTARPINPQLAIASEPILTPQQAHDQSILSAHPDAFQIAQSHRFQVWLQANPGFKRVADGGTADEVIRMLAIYKSNAATAQAREIKAPTVVPPPRVAPSKDVEKAMQNLDDWSNRNWNELRNKGG